MSFDLQRALLAAAEEAGKMQKEFESSIESLTQHINYVEGENERLKKKVQKAAEVAKQFTEILLED